MASGVLFSVVQAGRQKLVILTGHPVDISVPFGSMSRTLILARLPADCCLEFCAVAHCSGGAPGKPAHVSSMDGCVLM